MRAENNKERRHLYGKRIHYAQAGSGKMEVQAMVSFQSLRCRANTGSGKTEQGMDCPRRFGTASDAYPSEPRMEPPKLEHGSAYKDTIYRMTMSGFPDFNVRTHIINGRTYLVHSCFTANSGRTLREKLYGYAMQKAVDDCKKEGVSYLDQASQREILTEIHEEDIQDMPGGEEIRSYYLENFIAIGYSQTEIDELMAKIDGHIARRNQKLGIE